MHKTLMHASKGTMIAIAKNNLITGFELTPQQIEDNFAQCLACVQGRMKKQPSAVARTDYSKFPPFWVVLSMTSRDRVQSHLGITTSSHSG
jgi:hypothetical protein